MMWKCDKLQHWLSSSPTESSNKRYRHRLLKENLTYRPEILEDIKLLIQQAHDDARRSFRGFTANTLDLLGIRVPDLAKGYLEYFDLTTLKGYFGEIFAGLIAENFSPFGIDDWEVPAFLFRFHGVAFDQLERMRETGEKPKAIFGRTGNDCLAFQLDEEGRIKRTLICEAKCSDSHDASMIAEAHEQISDPGSIPVSVWQLIEILEDRSHDSNASTWLSALDGLRFGDVSEDYERCDLVSYVYGQLPKRNPTWIPQNAPHQKYTEKRRLEAVEIHLHNVNELVQEVYAKGDTKPEPQILPTEITQPPERIVELARALRKERAESFPRTIARLYSQHTKLRANQPGLPSWRKEEFLTRLDEAIRLVEAAFIERKALQDNTWRRGVQRAGELLEWLTHAEMNPERLPLGMLSAAAYQLAGYPARATGILSEHLREDTESKILYSFLKADFRGLLRTLTTYWGKPSSQDVAEFDFSDTLVSFPDFQYLVVKETASALGILCSAIRWGDEERLDKALEKLSTVSKMLLHGHDFYSWLLAKLCSEVIATYANSSLRFHLTKFSLELNEVGQQALEIYLRLCYQHRQTLAWPSQICGIERLKLQKSFPLCTPTGSGKTTVAELAILQSLFSKRESDVSESDSEDLTLQDPFSDIFFDEQLMAEDNYAPLAIYLVPSRALAAEVENKLSRALGHLNTGIVVTGLYGGTDWGPTDVWLTEEKPIVLICTYEKAEALMRFLGPFFRDRISLVVIDEAHSVDFGYRQDDSQERINLQKAESRALRLESLGTRLLAHLQEHHSRVIALSAVTSGIENALAGWVSGQVDAIPAKTSDRSTRQLIGRLECLRDKRFSIRYDLLDGKNLQFEKDSEDTPYIPNPFPPHPSAPDFENKGPEKRLRPSLLWAAMHLAKPDEQEQPHAVLISITQRIDGYVEDFLTLLEQTWDEVDKPDFFHPPTEARKIKIWGNCLKSCEDYFTSQSYEYRLLKRGIIVHHGNMPGLMARLLVEAIQEQIVHIVVATSTLSEGVNLPFETVLIPSLRRSGKPLNIREFGNLVGRAGRPGFGTEGRSLVLTAPRSNQEKAYFKLVNQLRKQNIVTDNAQSPLAQLLISLYEQWSHISKSTQIDEFLTWLEQTAPLTSSWNSGDESQTDAIETLDTLDSVLLAVIVEVEQIVGQEELSLDELEEQLCRIWQHSYARYATMKEQAQAHLENFFIRRGRALKARIYPDPVKRKKLYRTSLPPRSGEELSNLYPTIKQHLEAGKEYVKWDVYRRFNYIQTIIEQLSTLEKLTIEPHKHGWQNVLRWWFKIFLGTTPPSSNKEISQWYAYVNKNFVYRFNWGVGSIIALAIEDKDEDVLPSIENWPETGLPWIVFWLKELIIWGTLEPVAAYFLARRIKITRAEAEETARKYYEEQPDIQNPDELLNAVAIRKWAQELSGSAETQDDAASEPRLPALIPVTLLKDFTQASKQTWRVVPVETETKLFWYDPAGVPLASCEKFEKWQPQYLNTHDFMLNSSEKEVSSKPYI